MSKELIKEYLEDLDHYDEGMGIHSTSYEKCKERLIRLAEIDNAKPSEALACLEYLYCSPVGYIDSDRNKDYNTIKQALQRLESIDNVNSSEALKSLEDLRKQVSFANSDGCIFDDIYEDIIKDIELIKQALIKAQEQEKVLNELIKLVKDLEPTFNRKGVSSDTDILGTIIKDYFYDNASDLLKTYFEKNIQK